MEIHSPSYPALFTLFLFMFMAVNLLWRSKSKKSILNLPPGPWKLPIIGNMHNLAGSLPHQSLRNLAMKYGPLMHLQLGEVSNIIVSSPEMAKEVMKIHDAVFASRPTLLAVKIITYDCKGVSFSPCGSYWRQLRKICAMELLSSKRVKSFRSIREEEVSNLVETIYHSSDVEASVAINLSEKIYSLNYGITSRTAFGKKSREQEAYIEISKQISKLAGGFYVSDMYPSIKMLQWIGGLRHKLEKVHEEADRILGNILSDHKEKKIMKSEPHNHEEEADNHQEEFVDILLKIQESDQLDLPLTDSSIKAVRLDIFTAGSQTSSTLVEWAMSEMLKNPRVMKEAQSDSCVIDGYDIPIKSKVIVNAWAIGRDPMHWFEAEKFWPERFLHDDGLHIDYKGADFEFIPFGAGRRICPGMTFGMIVVELTLAQLLFHFDWKLPNDMKPEDLDMTEVFGLSVRKKVDLWLNPVPYCSN
ncbi:hypothetical protein FNV43_RR00238 [Rhamnella rubrinervis]|uniref:Cytochrome P450 n=1 Tax=Rhamnella rubrinervis TaxID=2594499 RepID=A0A8K0HNT0_9ROSA|nr:hypothetical protein FNV43_RR00238 [Rhamnella rubrinervis]